MKNKGISLIVLVITIILMIIIAGAIIISLTETNIIDQAQNAVGKHNDAELKQRITLTLAEAQANRYSEEIVTNNLKVLFEEVYGKDNITVVKSGNNYKVKLKDSNEVLKVKTDGTIEEYKEMAPTQIYARLDDEGVLYLRATEQEGYRLYKNYTSIENDWNTAGDATAASVVKVIIEEEIAPTTADSFFAHMSNLVEIENMYNLHTENVTSMVYMFDGCKKIAVIDLSYFDTSKVTTMKCMFSGCSAVTTIDVTSFDTSKTTNMTFIFYGCKSLTTIDLSSFDTSNTIKFGDMFNGCENLTTLDLTNFATSNAENMERMFSNCRKLQSIDVSNFNTSNVKGLGLNSMFSNCNSLEKIVVSSFDTSNTTSLGYLFYGCNNLTDLDLSNFDTMNITSLKQMFFGCKTLKTVKLSDKFVINDEVDLTQVLINVPSDIKITATKDTRDKLISASSLTEANFEIIESVEN